MVVKSKIKTKTKKNYKRKTANRRNKTKRGGGLFGIFGRNKQAEQQAQQQAQELQRLKNNENRRKREEQKKKNEALRLAAEAHNQSSSFGLSNQQPNKPVNASYNPSYPGSQIVPTYNATVAPVAEPIPVAEPAPAPLPAPEQASAQPTTPYYPPKYNFEANI